MRTKRFGELAIGTRFCFRARRYEKVAPEIGRDEERGGNVFHAHTEVMAEPAKEEWRKDSGRQKTPLTPSPVGRGSRAPVQPVWHPQRRVRWRLGREPGRELRAYGTL